MLESEDGTANWRFNVEGESMAYAKIVSDLVKFHPDLLTSSFDSDEHDV